MKTSFELVDLIWKRLNTSAPLKSAINGGLYKFRRPDGSILQDVVVNSLVVSNDQLQQCVLNINFHCPNSRVTIAGQPAVSIPDNVKMNEVTQIIIPLIDNYAASDVHFYVSQQLDFEEPGTQENISNIRINVFSINL